MLTAQRRTEAELARTWTRIEESLRATLSGLLRDDASIEAILERLRAEVRPTARARLDAIVTGTRSAAGHGHAAGVSTPEAAFGELGAAASRRIAAGMAPDAATRLATRYLDGDRAIGGLRLSERLHARSEESVRALAVELRDGIRAGRTVADLAQSLLEVDDVRVALPRYIADLRAAVRVGDRVRLRAAVNDHVGSVNRLTDPTLRAAARRFQRVAMRATNEDLERQLGYWIRDRALYTERVVARTETARAFTAAFHESTREQPWVKGYRWELSPQHPRPDICDVYAAQSIDGLGPGGYEVDGVPTCPAHPNCLCFTTAILDDRHFERELAEARGEPPPPEGWRDPHHETAAEWISRQPPSMQHEILGPGRLRAFQREPSRVVGPRGALRPLWEVEGRSRPVPPPRRWERATERDPFREAGSRAPVPVEPAGEVPGSRATYRYTHAMELVAGPPLTASEARAELREALPRWTAASTADRAEWLPAGSRVRRAFRGYMRSRGILSRDVMRELEGAAEMRFETMPDPRVLAYHSIRRGAIGIGSPSRSAFGSAAAMEALDGRAGPARDIDDHFSTVFHEELHGASSMNARTAYVRHGRVLEEACVEMTARRLTGEMLGRDAPTSGAYQTYLAAMAAALPESYRAGRPLRESLRRISDAWIGMLQRGPETITTAEEYSDALAAELPEATAEERAEWGRTLRRLIPAN